MIFVNTPSLCVNEVSHAYAFSLTPILLQIDVAVLMVMSNS